MFGRDHEFHEPALRQEQVVRSEDLRYELQRISDGSQPAETKDDAEGGNDFWSIEEDSISRRHVEPRVHLHVSKEEIFPIQLKFLDVNKTTHTNLDVLQEKRINDTWNVGGDRTLTYQWTRFTKFTLLNEKLPPEYVWSGRRLTKIQETTRLDCLRSEIWTGV